MLGEGGIEVGGSASPGLGLPLGIEAFAGVVVVFGNGDLLADIEAHLDAKAKRERGANGFFNPGGNLGQGNFAAFDGEGVAAQASDLAGQVGVAKIDFGFDIRQGPPREDGLVNHQAGEGSLKRHLVTFRGRKFENFQKTHVYGRVQSIFERI